MPGIVKVMIVDRYPLIHIGVIAAFSAHEGISVVGSVFSGSRVLLEIEKIEPDIVLMDVKLLDLDTRENINRYISERNMRMICLAESGDEDDVVRMMAAGSSGVVMKYSDPSELVIAVEKVMVGEIFYCKNSASNLINMLLKDRIIPLMDSSMPSFSTKELAIIKLICLQCTSKEISERVFLGAKTVEYYRQRIMNKMQVRNTVGLVLYAIKNNIVNV